MGHWGVKSYENDEVHDALDAGFARVHGAVYDDLMDDRNPLTLEEVQEKLAGPETLAAALQALHAEYGENTEAWDEVVRLAYGGIVIRHAELKVPLPEDVRLRALEWLEAENIEWDEVTKRQLRRDREITFLRKLGG